MLTTKNRNITNKLSEPSKSLYAGIERPSMPNKDSKSNDTISLYINIKRLNTIIGSSILDCLTRPFNKTGFRAPDAERAKIEFRCCREDDRAGQVYLVAWKKQIDKSRSTVRGYSALLQVYQKILKKPKDLVFYKLAHKGSIFSLFYSIHVLYLLYTVRVSW